MLIGELVKRSGLSKDTIRFYERKGLIRLDKKHRTPNNYKHYSEGVLQKLQLIVKLKDMSFTLNEIDIFLSRWQDEDASCRTLKHTLETKLDHIDEQLKKLAALRTRVHHSVEKCNGGDCEFEKTVRSCRCQ